MTGVAEKLPSEIKMHIASYCLPGTLTSLALAQRTFQVEAEQALYATIAVSGSSSESPWQLSVFATLAVNPEKAACVRFLQVTYRNDGIEHDTAAEGLMSALPQLVSLEDLRIRFHHKEQNFGEELSKILKSRHFQLHTLFFNEWLDISGIIKRQSSLQYLGIYELSQPSTLEALEQVVAEPVPFPLTFCLQGPDPPFLEGFHLTLFPTFMRPEAYAPIFRRLERIFARDRGHPKVDLTQICGGSLYFDSLGDTDYVTDFVLGMTDVFSDLRRLSLLGQRPIKQDFKEIKQTITLAPPRKLGFLRFEQLWDANTIMNVTTYEIGP